MRVSSSGGAVARALNDAHKRITPPSRRRCRRGRAGSLRGRPADGKRRQEALLSSGSRRIRSPAGSQPGRGAARDPGATSRPGHRAARAGGTAALVAVLLGTPAWGRGGQCNRHARRSYPDAHPQHRPQGACIDYISPTRYRETVDPDSLVIVLLAPAGKRISVPRRSRLGRLELLAPTSGCAGSGDRAGGRKETASYRPWGHRDHARPTTMARASSSAAPSLRRRTRKTSTLRDEATEHAPARRSPSIPDARISRHRDWAETESYDILHEGLDRRDGRSGYWRKFTAGQRSTTRRTSPSR